MPSLAPEIWEDLTWFQDDQMNQLSRVTAQLNYQYYRYEYSFSIWQFIEAFLLHFVYLGFMGPLMIIPGFFYWPYLRMMGNMRFFWGCPSFLFQTFHWFVNILIILGRYQWNLSTVTDGYILLAVVVLFMRCAFIAAKYATFPAMYRQRYLNRYISSLEVNRFVLAGPWGNQDPNFVEEMIEQCMRRKFIDASTFKLAFIEEPSEEV